MIAKTLEHWNGHQLVALDVETTGTRPFWHEIVQVAAVALNADFQPRKDIMPFDIYLCPEHPERVDPDALKVTGFEMTDLLRKGINPDKARDMFEIWTTRLELGMTPSGTPKRIIPLAHGWAFDKPFFQDWLGYATFDELLDSRFRDTMCVSLFMNDHAAFHNERVPYSKNTLGWLCAKLGVENVKAHDALQDCLATAECYHRLCKIGVIA
jgi:DNA polymerase III epsilon subunit-like protein